MMTSLIQCVDQLYYLEKICLVHHRHKTDRFQLSREGSNQEAVEAVLAGLRALQQFPKGLMPVDQIQLV